MSNAARRHWHLALRTSKRQAQALDELQVQAVPGAATPPGLNLQIGWARVRHAATHSFKS